MDELGADRLQLITIDWQGDRMNVQNVLNVANKVEFSYSKRREIIHDGLTAASLRQIFD